jgi:hypothetical protein
MSFGLQSLFLWAVFLQRKTLADSLIGIATGPKAPGRDASLKLLSVYAGGRIAGRLSRPLRRGARSMAGRSDRLVGGFMGAGGDSGDRPHRPRRAPLFGTSYSAPVGRGGDASGTESRGQGERSRSGTDRGEGAAKDAGSTARTSSRTSREAAAASGAKGPGSSDKRSSREKKASEKPPRGPRTEKEQRPERPSQREQGQGGRPPVRKDTSSRDGDPGLGAELRRERGEALRKPSTADSSKPSREPAPPPKRRRSWRKGDKR